MKISILIFLMLSTLTCMAAEQINCDQVWSDLGHIVQIDTPVWRTPQFPEDGFIEEFSINVLKRESGDLFQPRTIEESVCALDVMLGVKTRDALRSGLEDYLGSPSIGSVEENIDKIWVSINRRLDTLYVDSGMASGLGINLILGQVEDQFGVRLYGGAENYGALQNKALTDGVHNPHSVSLWIWMIYLEYLDVDGFDSKKFLDYLKLDLEWLEQ